MTNENRCEPPPETPNYVVHVSDDAAGIQWRGIRYRLSALTPPATVAALVEALEWMITNDDTNEGDTPMPELGGQTWDEFNASGIEGLNRARAALALYREAGR